MRERTKAMGAKMRFLGAALMLLAAGSANADQLLGQYKVRSVFAETNDNAGVYFTVDLTQCLYGLMYIDLTSNGGKARLALLMTAKSSGWSATRLDYTKDANGKCVLYSLHVE